MALRSRGSTPRGPRTPSQSLWCEDGVYELEVTEGETEIRLSSHVYAERTIPLKSPLADTDLGEITFERAIDES